MPELADYVADARLLLITGVTLAVMEAPEKLMELLRLLRGRTPIALDTNYRARLWSSPDAYRARFEEILPFVDILLPTRSDLEAIYPDEPIEPLIERIAMAGPSTIAMKCGADGCAVWDGAALRPYPPPEVIAPLDTTGAGDAFNAGFLSALLRGHGMEIRCDVGQRVAARALRVRGALDHAFDGGTIAL